MMLAGLDGTIDVIVPRGGKGLVARVQTEARVPVFAHLDGNCHVYVDRAATSKWRRRSCSTPRCAAPASAARPRRCWSIAPAPQRSSRRSSPCCSTPAARCAATPTPRKVDTRVKPATEADWATEFLDAIIAVKVVDGVDGAIDHIETLRLAPHRRDHHATIRPTAEKFLREVDSAIVLHNASTQFADGGEFGFGAEIGIATGRLHARGPVGVEQLTTFKYRVRGSGQVRP